MKKIDNYGIITYDSEDIIDLYMNDKFNENIIAKNTDKIVEYNNICKQFDVLDKILNIYVKPKISLNDFDKQNQNIWFFPNSYKNINVKEYVLNKCKTIQEINRVELEFKLFEKYGELFNNVLKLLIYLVDYFRENNILWGIGRGSSVASYSLYLIGIHKVNSLQYDIPISDFIKE